MQNYRKLDSMIRFCYKSDLYKTADYLGCRYVSEVVCTCYKSNSPTHDVAKLFDVSHETVNYWKKKWGLPKLSHGGNRKNRALMNPKNLELIKSRKGKMSGRLAGEDICSSSAARAIWHRMEDQL